MNLRSQLAYYALEICHGRMLSMMILDPLGSIGNRSDSQMIGSLENLGYCTPGSHPHLFSLGLVLLIL